MPRIIAVMNPQIAVGKTTTVVNLAHALSSLGHQVTAIDMTADKTLTGLLNASLGAHGLSDVMLNNMNLAAVITQLKAGFNLVSPGTGLLDYEHIESGSLNRAKKLKQAIANSQVKHDDFVLIDCPSQPGLLMFNALFAADEVLVPVTPSYMSLQGLVRVTDIFKRIYPSGNSLSKLWLILTRVGSDSAKMEAIKSKVITQFPQRMFASAIAENSVIASTSYDGTNIFTDQRSDEANDYLLVADDILYGRTL